MNVAVNSEFLHYWILVFLALFIIYIVQRLIPKIRILILANKLPGPKAWPIIGNAVEFLKHDVDILDKIWKYNQQYGLVRFWFGPNLNVFISTAEDAEIYYSSSALLDRSEHFEFMKQFLREGLFTANGSSWKRSRKLLEPLFRHAASKSFPSICKEETDVLIGLLEKEVGKPVLDICDYLKKCLIDIIARTACEVEVNAQVKDYKVIEDVDVLMNYVANRMFSLSQQNDFLYGLTEIGKDYYHRQALALEFIENMIALKKKSVEEKYLKNDHYNVEELSFVERILLQSEMSDDEIRDHISTILTTGYESTSCQISFALVLLGIHQDVQEKLYQEILSVEKNGLNDIDLGKLEYLDKVIKESMRIFPAVPILFRKATEDVHFGKNLVPKGTAVGINIFAIHRNPKYYKNSNLFNPENFSKENVDSRHPYAFVPFGRGARKCIGKKVAWMSLRTIIAKIILNYKVECDMKMEEISVRMELTLKMTNGYPIRLLKRQTST